MKKLNVKMPKQLPLKLRQKLVTGVFTAHDPEELFYMQDFPKLRQDGTGYSHSNVVEFCKINGYDLGFGYRIKLSKSGAVLKKELHSFALKNGQVIELDYKLDWKGRVHYIGVKVEPELHKNLMYISKANTEFYKDRSPFALFEKDFLKVEPKEDIENENGG